MATDQGDPEFSQAALRRRLADRPQRVKPCAILQGDIYMTAATAEHPLVWSMSQALARNWGWVLLRGVLGIIAGIIAFTSPLATVGLLVIVFAVYSAADGILAIVSAVRAARAGERWIWFVLEGLIDIAAAAVALFMPSIAVQVFVIIISIWAIFSGIAMIVAAFKLHREHGRLWLILGGILSVAWGVLLIMQPVIGVLVLTYWFGAYALIFGILLVIVAFKLRGLLEKKA
jgi:uncharacterized membrane protein HdeD (DUF308 family)